MEALGDLEKSSFSGNGFSKLKTKGTRDRDHPAEVQKASMLERQGAPGGLKWRCGRGSNMGRRQSIKL